MRTLFLTLLELVWVKVNCSIEWMNGKKLIFFKILIYLKLNKVPFLFQKGESYLGMLFHETKGK